MKLTPEHVVQAIRSVTGAGFQVLHEPAFVGNEWQYLKECLDSGFVSSVGAFVDRFEKELADFTGARHAVAVVNGTAALHIALLMAGVEPGDEVLIPALTFVATANAVSYAGAVPHFVDADESNFGIGVQALRDYLERSTEKRDGRLLNRATGRVVRAMVPMHVFGHPSDLEGLTALARDFQLALVEDAAESLGSTYQDKHCGTFGITGALSFNGNKTITTGGGGAVLTDDPELARRAKHVTTTAKVPHPYHYEHDEIGFNYRMPNLNAALGCAQLESLPGFIEKKRVLFEKYREAFAPLPGVEIVSEPAGSRSNYWLQALKLSPENAGLQETILEYTNAHEVMTRPVWKLLHRLLPFAQCPRMELDVAESLERRLINIPSSPGIVS